MVQNTLVNHAQLILISKTQQPAISLPRQIIVGTNIVKILVRLHTMEYIQRKNASHALPFQRDAKDAIYFLKNKCQILILQTIK